MAISICFADQSQPLVSAEAIGKVERIKQSGRLSCLRCWTLQG
jgi:hypothetical protein